MNVIPISKTIHRQSIRAKRNELADCYPPVHFSCCLYLLLGSHLLRLWRASQCGQPVADRCPGRDAGVLETTQVPQGVIELEGHIGRAAFARVLEIESRIITAAKGILEQHRQVHFG